jgi:hypothetical protein
VLLLLAGCATPAPVYLKVCPQAPVYSKAFEQAAGAQLAFLPDGSPIVKMLSDYIAVRKEIKDCQR